MASEFILFTRMFETSFTEITEDHRNNCIRLSGLDSKTMAFFFFPSDCKPLRLSLEFCFPSLASSRPPVDPAPWNNWKEKPQPQTLSPRHASHWLPDWGPCRPYWRCWAALPAACTASPAGLRPTRASPLLGTQTPTATGRARVQHHQL